MEDCDMTKQNYCVIMAGGIGSRFWPLSKDNYPKQFLDILGTGKSFIRSTFDRFLPIVPAENFLVVTNAAYKELVLEHLPQIKPDQVLCEPMRRNTAPCIAYATYHIMAKCKDANIVVTPADHLVTNEVEFQRIISKAFDFVAQTEHNEALLTIGIQPTRPETGYGYIQVDEESVAELGTVVKLKSFTEKPNLEKAKQFLAAGSYFWNSGIFVWSMNGIKTAFDTYLPEIVEVFDRGKDVFATAGEQEFIDANFADCTNISIDYGVMEKSPNTYTIPANFGWSDIGTWGSLFNHAAKDINNNAVAGKVVLVNTNGTIVNIQEGVEAVVQGLENYLVAYRDNSLLICKLSDEQKIKEWIAEL